MFGIDAYRNLSEIIGDSSSALEAFLLGNLGPDPFFYLMATPATRKFRRIGLPDEFAVLGDPDEVYKYYGMDPEGIARTISALMKR